MSSPRPATVRAVPLPQVAHRAGARCPGEAAAVAVTGVTLDSRSVRPGDVYAALPGFRVHGASFASDAVAAGAVAVLTDAVGAATIAGSGGVAAPLLVVDAPRAVLGEVAALVYGNPARDLTLYGITGTNGKTTTAYLVESALRGLGVATGLLGTVETRIGPNRLGSVRTTPEAPDLHATFAVMREQGVRSVVMEVSSHALRQHRVDGAVFDVALFTNLSQDHLDFHPSMEDYFATKALLFSPLRSRQAVVCVDDEWGRRLARQCEVPLTTVTSHGDVAADWLVVAGAGPRLTVRGPAGALELPCHLPGTFNLVNTAMAAVALLVGGHEAADVRRAMANEPTVPGRMEVVTASTPDPDRDPCCVVDYAHTPGAVEAALGALRPGTRGRLVAVLGAGGDRDRGKRPAMGAAAARWADDVVVTDDNPRSEDPATIRAEVASGAAEAVTTSRAGGPTVTDVPGRAAAIAVGVRLARESRTPAQSTVAVLGKGHEKGQEVAGTVHPFDDRDALRAALDGLDYRPEAAE